MRVIATDHHELCYPNLAPQARNISNRADTGQVYQLLDQVAHHDRRRQHVSSLPLLPLALLSANAARSHNTRQLQTESWDRSDFAAKLFRSTPLPLGFSVRSDRHASASVSRRKRSCSPLKVFSLPLTVRSLLLSGELLPGTVSDCKRDDGSATPPTVGRGRGRAYVAVKRRGRRRASAHQRGTVRQRLTLVLSQLLQLLRQLLRAVGAASNKRPDCDPHSMS